MRKLADCTVSKIRSRTEQVSSASLLPSNFLEARRQERMSAIHYVQSWAVSPSLELSTTRDCYASCRRSRQSRQWFLGSAWSRNQVRRQFSCEDVSSDMSYNSSNLEVNCVKMNTLAAERKGRKTAEKTLQSDVNHIEWWDEKLKSCRKPLTKDMIKRLKFDNQLGLDELLRSGSLKKGTKSAEILEWKKRFPREIFLCRAGEIYEALGIDACMLVEYVGVPPMGGKDTVPKAGCPTVNLRPALDELIGRGFSVCIVEEVQGSLQGRGRRKERFIAGHAHPGSPYVYGLAAENLDLEFPDPVPVVGISHTERGYCLVSVLETMRTFSVEDGLTEEAVVALLRAQECFKLFTHSSLLVEDSGNGSWGRRGLLWGECERREQEWYEDDPVDKLLSKVREIYGLGQCAEFREILVPPGQRPRPLYVGTASQIGIIPTVGVPSLLNVILPSEANHLCTSYLRNLLLHPPPYRVAECIQGACGILAELTSPLPDFTCVSMAKLKKLIEANEANHIVLAQIRNLAEDVLYMAADPELTHVLDLLLEPTWLDTGLRIGRKQLVDDCKMLASKTRHMLACEGDADQSITQSACIPDDFFRDLEEPWKGRVKRKHAESVYREVETAARELANAVESDFLPVILRMEGYDTKGLIVEVCYSSEDQAVWLRGKSFKLQLSSDATGNTEAKRLVPALDCKGKKVGEEWWTTSSVESGLTNYRAAVDKATSKALELLKAVAETLKSKTDALSFISSLSIIAETLSMHVREGKKRNWSVPILSPTDRQMVLVDLVPYWNDPSQEQVQPNMVEMDSMFLLTGPNGGGKSSILRSICAGALLATCGLMVPARKATIPHLDAIILRMMSTDSPVDSKSAFQMEMAELRTILVEATDRSLVLVDELCRGTDVGKGSFIAASVIETLDRIGCIGVLSTHLHDLLDMELQTSKVVQKAMGTKEVHGRLYPTWKLVDGACRESLAFEVARKEGVPASVVDRAEELCVTRILYPNGSPSSSLGDGRAGGKGVDYTVDERMTAEKLFIMIARFVINWKPGKT